MPHPQELQGATTRPLDELYQSLRAQDPSFTVSPADFEADMQHDDARRQLYEYLKGQDQAFTVTFEEFTDDLGVKKKSTPVGSPAGSGAGGAPASTGGVAEPGRPAPAHSRDFARMDAYERLPSGDVLLPADFRGEIQPGAYQLPDGRRAVRVPHNEGQPLPAGAQPVAPGYVQPEGSVEVGPATPGRENVVDYLGTRRPDGLAALATPEEVAARPYAATDGSPLGATAAGALNYGQGMEDPDVADDGFWATFGKSLRNSLDPRRISGNLVDFAGDLTELIANNTLYDDYGNRLHEVAELGKPIRDNKTTDRLGAEWRAAAKADELPVSVRAQQSVLDAPTNAAAWGNLLGQGAGSVVQVGAASLAGGPLAGAAAGGALGISATKDAAREAGISDEEATVTAAVLAPIQGVLEELGMGFITKNPAARRLLQTEIMRRALAYGEGKIMRAGLVRAASEIMPEMVKRYGGRAVAGAAGEAVTEGLQTAAEGEAQVMADELRGNADAPAGRGRYGTTQADVLRNAGEAMAAATVLGGAGGAAHARLAPAPAGADTATAYPVPTDIALAEQQAAQQAYPQPVRIVRPTGQPMFEGARLVGLSPDGTLARIVGQDAQGQPVDTTVPVGYIQASVPTAGPESDTAAAAPALAEAAASATTASSTADGEPAGVAGQDGTAPAYGTPAENRRAGRFVQDGQLVERPAPLAERALLGDATQVEFATGVLQPARYAVVEAADLQPSHVGGAPNPRHFLPEAQPKNRSAAFDQASQQAIQAIADAPDAARLGAAPNAYSGAPVVNSRGEVLQGNGRAAGLLAHYRQGGTAYREQVAAQAAAVGIPAQAVASLQAPVLVRVADVSDRRAVELGNFTAADTESGGQRSLDVRQTAARLSTDGRAALVRLLAPQGEATQTETIRANQDALLTLLRREGVANPTQLQTLLGPDGRLTPPGVEAVAAVQRQLLFSDGDPNLPELFRELPPAAQQGLDRAAGALLGLPAEAGILPELQNALVGVREWQASGVDFATWAGQGDVFRDGQAPAQRYSPLELRLIQLLATEKRPTQIARVFAQYAQAVAGQAPGLFGATPPVPRAAALADAFNLSPDDTAPQPDAARPADGRPAAPTPRGVASPATAGPAAAAPAADLVGASPDAGATAGPVASPTAARLASIREERAAAVADLKNILKGRKKSQTLNGSFVPLDPEMVVAAARILKTYVQEGVVRAEDLIARFRADVGTAEETSLTDDDLRVLVLTQVGPPPTGSSSTPGRPAPATPAAPGQSVLDLLQGMWYANVLSSYGTHVVNAVANTQQALLETLIATGRVAVQGGQVTAPVRGLAQGLRAGAQAAREVLATGQEPGGAGSKFDVPSALEAHDAAAGGFRGALATARTAPAEAARGNLVPLGRAAVDMTVAAQKYVPRLLKASDVFFQTGLREMRAWELASLEAAKQGRLEPTRQTWESVYELLANTEQRRTAASAQATAEGLAGRAHALRMWELMEQSRPVGIQEDARAYGARAVFNGEMEGTLGVVFTAVNGAVQQLGPVASWVVPFAKVIANVANTYLDYTLHGFVRAAKGGIGFERQGAQYRRYTAEERATVLAKATLGAAVLASVYAATHREDERDNLQLSGPGPRDFKLREQLRQNGWLPYAVKVGEKWVSYKESPLFFVLGAAGALLDLEKYEQARPDEDDAYLSQASALVFQTLSMVVESTATKNLAEGLDAVASTNTGGDKFSRWLQRTGTSAATGYAPFSGLMRQLSRDAQALAGADKKQARGPWETIQQDLPVFREGLRPAIDALGDPVKVRTDRLTSGRPTHRDAQTQQLWDVLTEKGVAIPVPNQRTLTVPRWLESARPAKPGQGADAWKEAPPSDELYYELLQLRGRWLKQQLLDRLPKLRAMSTDEARTEVKQLGRAATEQAKQELMQNRLGLIP